MKPLASQQRWPARMCGSVWKAALGAGASLGLLALAGCGGGGTTLETTAATSVDWQWALPANFPTPRVPADNPMSAAKVDLGRHLFYDVRLSGNGTLSCASCHQQARAFTDGVATSAGSTGQHTPRNAQPLANVAYAATLTWANPSLTSLEQQMAVPLFGTSPVEMGVNDDNKAEVLARIRAAALYPAKFRAAFVGEAEPVSWGNIVKAIAAFQRSLLSASSRYDQAQQGLITLTAQEQRGQQLFFGEKAECFHCHGSFNFNDQVVHASTRVLETPFHNTGLYNLDGQGAYPAPNRGVYELTGVASDMGRFRAPSLRNVAVTAPYFHDGSAATLEEVLDSYAAGGRHLSSGPDAGDGRLNPYKSSLVARINLSAQDKADLLAFLQALTDERLLTNPAWADPFK